MQDAAKPPALKIARWEEVFETAESRRHKSLTWIATPVSFNCTGLQTLLDIYEPFHAAAMFGAWCALCKIAATSPTRGTLAGSAGEPYTASRLARLSGFPAELFVELIPFAVSVGWLVPAATKTAPDPPSPAERTDPVDTPAPAPATTEETTTHRRDWQTAIRESDQLQALEGQTILPTAGLLAETAGIFTPAAERAVRAHFDQTRNDFHWPALWYSAQLAAPTPLFTDATAAEAALCVAAAIRAAKTPNAKKRWALWNTWIRNRDASQLTDADIDSGARIVSDLLRKRARPAADKAPDRRPLQLR